jgi:hypothetical protein
MLIKKFLKSCRYGHRILIFSVLILLSIVVIAVGIRIFCSQTKRIAQLKMQIMNPHPKKVKVYNSQGKVVNTALKLDGIIVDNGVLYAIFNGHPFQPTERIAGKYEVLEISRYEVSVRNLQNSETIVFTLVNPSAIPKVPLKSVSNPRN